MQFEIEAFTRDLKARIFTYPHRTTNIWAYLLSHVHLSEASDIRIS